MKFDEKVIGVFDTFWGELYRTLGLKALFKSADVSYGFEALLFTVRFPLVWVA